MISSKTFSALQLSSIPPPSQAVKDTSKTGCFISRWVCSSSPNLLRAKEEKQLPTSLANTSSVSNTKGIVLDLADHHHLQQPLPFSGKSAKSDNHLHGRYTKTAGKNVHCKQLSCSPESVYPYTGFFP